MEASIDLIPAAENPAGEPAWDFQELSLRKMGHKSQYLFWRRHPQRRPRLPADSICHTEWRHTVLSRPNYRAEQHRTYTNLLRQQLHQVSESAGLNTCSAQIHSSNEPSSLENVKMSNFFFSPDGAVGTQILLGHISPASQRRINSTSIHPIWSSACGISIVDVGWGALYGHKVSHRFSCMWSHPWMDNGHHGTKLWIIRSQLKQAHLYIVAAAAQRFSLFSPHLKHQAIILAGQADFQCGSEKGKKNKAGHLVC